MIRRRLVVQLLQQDRGGNKRFGVGMLCWFQLGPPDLVLYVGAWIVWSSGIIDPHVPIRDGV